MAGNVQEPALSAVGELSQKAYGTPARGSAWWRRARRRGAQHTDPAGRTVRSTRPLQLQPRTQRAAACGTSATAEEVVGDVVQVGPHGLLGPVGVAVAQRIDDRGVLGVVAQAPLGAGRAALEAAPDR